MNEMSAREGWRDIAVSFRYEKNLLSRWLRQTAVHKKRGTVYMLILALLAVNFAVVIPTARQKAGPVVMTALCVGFIVFIWIKTRGKKGPQTVESLYQGGAEYRLFLRAEEWSVRSAGEERAVRYDAGVRVREYDGHYSVLYGAGHVFLIPKAALTDGQNQQLSGFYREKLGKNYKLCSR